MPRAAPRAVFVTATIAIAIATSSHVRADGDASALTLRVADPPSVPYEATALGRATHPLRFVLTNGGKTPIHLEPFAFHFRPTREGVQFVCDEPKAGDDRWPATLEPGASFTLAREVTCETPLPGRYDVETRGRPRGSPETAERAYGNFTMQIDPGANPPVRLPWSTSLYAAASGTREVPPVKDPNKVRIIVELINATRAPVALSPVHATMRVTRRDSRTPPCAERAVDLAFSGALAPGRTQSLSTPLGCELTAEAVYDVDISVANAGGARVHLATHAVRVGVFPPPPPRPEDIPQVTRVVGGM